MQRTVGPYHMDRKQKIMNRVKTWREKKVKVGGWGPEE